MKPRLTYTIQYPGSKAPLNQSQQCSRRTGHTSPFGLDHPLSENRWSGRQVSVSQGELKLKLKLKLRAFGGDESGTTPVTSHVAGECRIGFCLRSICSAVPEFGPNADTALLVDTYFGIILCLGDSLNRLTSSFLGSARSFERYYSRGRSR